MRSNERPQAVLPISHRGRVALARARVRYDIIVDGWVSFSDRLFEGSQRACQTLGRVALESPLIAPESKALVRLTLGLLVAVFAWILVSCQTPVGAPGRRAPRPESVRPQDKRAETLWLRRETLRIKPKDQGSTTGSIWADTDAPRQLLADERPQRQGETITVLIPDDLQFKPEGAEGALGPKDKAAGKDAKGNKDKKDKKVAANGETANGDGATFTDPSAVGIAANLPTAPLTSLKMQIVGIEPTGETFLRGTKSYRNNLGEQREVALFAKIPGRHLNSFEVDARDLTEIALTEQVNGQSSEYATSGWDPVVSRKLAGYAPDINAELQALEEVREELQMAQGAVNEQRKAMAGERDRIQKDRQRGFEETERLKAALGAAQNGEGKEGGPKVTPPGTNPASAASAASAVQAANNPQAPAASGAGAAGAPGPNGEAPK